jgi:dTDP-4-amino-4,6-dideoxygalactose transaminase
MVPMFSAVDSNVEIDLIKSIKRVLERQWYILGEEVKLFEREFAAYLGVTDCVTVANGTDALAIALKALGIKRGDKVITVANAGFYSSTAIHSTGAVPVYVDVSAASLTMAPTALAKALEDKPKCVIVTHLYGQIADMDDLLRLTRDAGVPLLEDCAQAHGALRNGRQAGSWGDVACFSFYPTKNLGALGDGGAVVTNNGEVAARLRTLRQYGWSTKYQVTTPGGCNSRLDEIQAAILREKLQHLNTWNAERRRIASAYNAAFETLPVISIPAIGEDYVAHLYVIRINERDAFRDFLKAKNIATDVHYPIPDHLQTAYPNACVVGEMGITEAASSSVVSLPCFPGLSDAEIDRVIAAVKAFFQR